ACMSQSALSYGLASWMHPQQSGLPEKRVEKPLRYRSKFRSGFSMSVTVLLLSVLKNERQQRYDKNSKGH
ncbi:hypothetical protein, partial [Phascolarctobacterium succinatutens]|uniref:hypothetical protein n=1 Tax=Phascolarctobacterium succinatutens TaxID=626940 RepID=UPI004029D7C9